MKHLKSLSVQLLVCIGIIVPFNSCELLGIEQCVKGDGEIFSYSENVGQFNSIVNNIPANIFINQDTSKTFESLPKVTIYIQKNIKENIIYKVEDSVLTIDFNGCIKSYSDIYFEIRCNRIRSLISNSPGSFYSNEIINADSLYLELNETGDFNLVSRTNVIHTNLMGSGIVTLDGQTKHSIINNSGVGDVFAFNLLADTTIAKTSNAGDIELFSNKLLSFSLSGVGNIYFKGEPTIDTVLYRSGALIESN